MASVILSFMLLGLIIHIHSYNFGFNNSYTCHCKDNIRCDSVTGRCNNECLRGWGGDSCQQENVALDSTHASQSGTYDNVRQFGPQLVVDGCTSPDRTVHPCSDTDTDNSNWQWWFIDLQQQYSIRYIKIISRDAKCSNGFYGAGCKKNCNNRTCLMESTCDHVTGECIGGCPVGYNPARVDCTQECRVGTFGEGCSKRCSDRYCKDSNLQCDSKTGECIDGCLPGFQFTDCTAECDAGFYGYNCSSNCSRFCQSDQCNNIDGACDCQDGYQGTDCTVIKDAVVNDDGSAESDDKDTTIIILAVIVSIVVFIVVIFGVIIFILYRKHKAAVNHNETSVNENTAPIPDSMYDIVGPKEHASELSEYDSAVHVPITSEYTSLGSNYDNSHTSHQDSHVYYNTTTGVSIDKS